MKQILLSLVLLLVVVGVAEAATYYVGTSGSDSNSCATAQSSSAANRKRMIFGANGVKSCLTQPGDRAIIGDGSYSEGVCNNCWVASGTEANPIVFTAEHVTSPPSVTVTFGSGTFGMFWDNRSWITIKGIKFNGGSIAHALFAGPGQGKGGTGLVFEDIECENPGKTCIATSALYTRYRISRVKAYNSALGLYFMGGTDSIIENSEFYNHSSTNSGCAQLNNNSGNVNTISRTIVRYNRFYGCAGFGLYVGYGTDIQVYGNISYASEGRGYRINDKVRKLLFYNNAAHGNKGDGINISTSPTIPTGVLRNNISIGNGGSQITTIPSGMTASHNLTSGTDTNIFIDPTNSTLGLRNYALKAGSAVLNAGTRAICTQLDINGGFCSTLLTVPAVGAGKNQGTFK
jgi:hypothetical protein